MALELRRGWKEKRLSGCRNMEAQTKIMRRRTPAWAMGAVPGGGVSLERREGKDGKVRGTDRGRGCGIMAVLLEDMHHLDDRGGALLLGGRSLRVRCARGGLVGCLLRRPC